MKTKLLKFLIIFFSLIVVIALAGFLIFTNLLSPVVTDKSSEIFTEFTANFRNGEAVGLCRI